MRQPDLITLTIGGVACYPIDVWYEDDDSMSLSVPASEVPSFVDALWKAARTAWHAEPRCLRCDAVLEVDGGEYACPSGCTPGAIVPDWAPRIGT